MSINTLIKKSQFSTLGTGFLKKKKEKKINSPILRNLEVKHGCPKKLNFWSLKKKTRTVCYSLHYKLSDFPTEIYLW